MSYAHKASVTITTDASGDATGYTEVVTGRIIQIRYVKSTYADGVDFVVTVEGTGEAVWSESNVNASATRAPRQATHDVLGAASLYAAAGEPVEDYIVVANDRIKIVVDEGGDTLAGTFHVLIG